MIKKMLMLLICSLLLVACHGKDDLQTIEMNPDQVKAIYDTADIGALGKKNAPITLVNIFSYDCSYCRKDYPLIESFAKQHPNVRVIFKSFMAFGDKTNVLPQYASLAAGKQGQFLAMHHALMTTDRPLTIKTIHALARELNLNMNQFDQDLHSTAIAQKIRDNTLLMDQLGIDGIPVVIMAPTSVSQHSETKAATQYIQIGFISNDTLMSMLNALLPKKE